MSKDKPADSVDFLSASQVADRLRVTPRHVVRLVNTGVIPIVGRFGVQNQLVFREEDVDAYQHRNT